MGKDRCQEIGESGVFPTSPEARCIDTSGHELEKALSNIAIGTLFREQKHSKARRWLLNSYKARFHRYANPSGSESGALSNQWKLLVPPTSEPHCANSPKLVAGIGSRFYRADLQVATKPHFSPSVEDVLPLATLYYTLCVPKMTFYISTLSSSEKLGAPQPRFHQVKPS